MKYYLLKCAEYQENALNFTHQTIKSPHPPSFTFKRLFVCGNVTWLCLKFHALFPRVTKAFTYMEMLPDFPWSSTRCFTRNEGTYSFSHLFDVCVMTWIKRTLPFFLLDNRSHAYTRGSRHPLPKLVCPLPGRRCVQIENSAEAEQKGSL